MCGGGDSCVITQHKNSSRILSHKPQQCQSNRAKPENSMEIYTAAKTYAKDDS